MASQQQQRAQMSPRASGQRHPSQGALDTQLVLGHGGIDRLQSRPSSAVFSSPATRIRTSGSVVLPVTRSTRSLASSPVGLSPHVLAHTPQKGVQSLVDGTWHTVCVPASSPKTPSQAATGELPADCRRSLALSPTSPSANLQHADADRKVWAFAQTQRVMSQSERDSLVEQGLSCFDRDVVASVTAAIQQLNQGSLQCPEGVCMMYSASSAADFILWRSDRRDAAMAIWRAAGGQDPPLLPPQAKVPVSVVQLPLAAFGVKPANASPPPTFRSIVSRQRSDAAPGTAPSASSATDGHSSNDGSATPLNGRSGGPTPLVAKMQTPVFALPSGGHAAMTPKRNGSPVPTSFVKLQAPASPQSNAWLLASPTARSRALSGSPTVARRSGGARSGVAEHEARHSMRRLMVGAGGAAEQPPFSASQAARASFRGATSTSPPPRAMPIVVAAPPAAQPPEAAAARRGGGERSGDRIEIAHRAFELHDVIGRGAFGVVWKATEEGANCSVAIKVISARDAMAFATASFEAELMQLVSATCHHSAANMPRYVIHSATKTCHASGAGFVRLAMSYVSGGPLDKWLYGISDEEHKTVEIARLVEGPLPGGQQSSMAFRRACAVVRDLLDQLSKVFGVVQPIAYHRDVSSHNVLIDFPEGPAKPHFCLIDFGLAVRSGSWGHDWRTANLAGDPRYWTPAAWMAFSYGFKYLVTHSNPGFQYQYLGRIDHFSVGILALETLFALWDPKEAADGSTPGLLEARRAWARYWSVAIHMFQMFHLRGALEVRNFIIQSADEGITAVVEYLKQLRHALRAAAEQPQMAPHAPLLLVLADLVAESGTSTWAEIPAMLLEEPDASRTARVVPRAGSPRRAAHSRMRSSGGGAAEHRGAAWTGAEAQAQPSKPVRPSPDDASRSFSHKRRSSTFF